jgi:hypothetical protein
MVCLAESTAAQYTQLVLSLVCLFGVRLIDAREVLLCLQWCSA